MAQTLEYQREHRLGNIKTTIDRIQARLNFCPADIIAGKVTAQTLKFVFDSETKRLERELKVLYKVLPAETQM